MKRIRGTRCVRVALAAGAIAGLAGCFGDGTTIVGNGTGQTKPGLYTTNVTSGFCYWARLSDFSGQLSGVIANSIQPNGRAFLQVLPTDRALSSDGCGTWDLAKSTSYNPNRAAAKSGQYRIPTDLLPGTYTAPGSQSCYWERLSSWTGGVESIIANNIGPGRQIVTIASSDAGFSSHDCGVWIRTG